MLAVYWVPNQSGAWLMWDDEAGELMAVPNRRGGWRQRRPYRGTWMPSQRHRVSPELANVVGWVVGVPGVPEVSRAEAEAERRAVLSAIGWLAVELRRTEEVAS